MPKPRKAGYTPKPGGRTTIPPRDPRKQPVKIGYKKRGDGRRYPSK